MSTALLNADGTPRAPRLIAAPKDMAPEALFEDWLSVREKDPVDPLSAASAMPYRYIWKKWLAWLQEGREAGAGAYRLATSEDIRLFLSGGPSPCSKRKGKTSQISPVTRERYARLLQSIYQHAIEHCGLVELNPVTDEVLGKRTTEIERAGQILPPGVFEALRQGIPVDPTPYQKRDAALLMLLLDFGLTSSEVRLLKLKDVSKNFQNAGQFTLLIEGPRAAQSRTLVTSGQTGYLLHSWLVHRNVMHRATDVVFISEKRGVMTTPGLFLMVSQLISEACRRVNMDIPNHIGPSIIRNTLIVRLYNAGLMSPDAICKLLGIKDPKILTRGLRPHLCKVKTL